MRERQTEARLRYCRETIDQLDEQIGTLEGQLTGLRAARDAMRGTILHQEALAANERRLQEERDANDAPYGSLPEDLVDVPAQRTDKYGVPLEEPKALATAIARAAAFDE